MTTFAEIENKIEMWGYERGICQNGKPMGQAVKTLEECVELVDAINRNDREAVIDAIGDVGVTLLMQCAVQKITFTECLEAAFSQIKDRKGFLRADGVFVKEMA
jgi:NTP pyrophosphatase (non-canonical NTP hydrolase)